MSRRYRHRARNACPMAPTGVACHAFGSEGACGLCSLIDMDAAVTVVTLGLEAASDDLTPAEAAFWAHLERRLDGGPRTPAELDAARRRKHDKQATPPQRTGYARAGRPGPLPIEPPF